MIMIIMVIQVFLVIGFYITKVFSAVKLST